MLDSFEEELIKVCVLSRSSAAEGVLDQLNRLKTEELRVGEVEEGEMERKDILFLASSLSCLRVAFSAKDQPLCLPIELLLILSPNLNSNKNQ